MWSGGLGSVAFQVFAEMSWTLPEAGGSVGAFVHQTLRLWHDLVSKSREELVGSEELSLTNGWLLIKCWLYDGRMQP